LQAYQEADKSGMSGREIEAYALTKAAVALKECQSQWNAPNRDQLLEHALKLNQRIWSIFQAELTREDNPLPPQIKQNLLRLSIYSDARGVDILAYPHPEKLTILININEGIAAGLRQGAVNMEKNGGNMINNGQERRGRDRGAPHVP
jgi:flagellar protein FlaF